MLAGGIGGTCGDMLMHSLDTVKTRQQGDPTFPPKYTSMGQSYTTIYRQEGLFRGLYGGVTPALLGSFPGTVIFFGCYEYTKRLMIDSGINPSIAYLSGGFFADLAASIVYVPSEVLKTRLQLQGRHNNPHFNSGYNYLNMRDGFRQIVRQEGFSALFHGYKATIFRDLPFSALQFAFYEKEQTMAKEWVGKRDIGLGLEILTAATAGGMAGVITCPMDVVKTRIQTQQNPSEATSGSGAKHAVEHVPKESPRPHAPASSHSHTSRAHSRPISTSGASTSIPPPGTPRLDTSSVFTGAEDDLPNGRHCGVVPRRGSARCVDQHSKRDYAGYVPVPAQTTRSPQYSGRALSFIDQAAFPGFFFYFHIFFALGALDSFWDVMTRAWSTLYTV